MNIPRTLRHLAALSLAVAVALPALADSAIGGGGGVTRGDLMKRRQYQTFGATTLYVDPTGNDGNACTSTGTGACLTIQGAIDKNPKRVLNPILINVAAGSYAGFSISGFTFDYPTDPSVGAYIWINGTLSNSTIATGSATGTATAGSAGSGSTFGTLTDGAATWTVNDLSGRFITTLTGTGSGQTRVIASNTGTVITIAGTWTAPANGTTYAIQDSASIVNSGVKDLPASPNTSSSTAFGGAIVAFSNNSTIPVNLGTADANIYIQNMRVALTGSGRGFTAGGPFAIAFKQSQFVMTALTGISVMRWTSVGLDSSSITTTSTASAFSTIAADTPAGFIRLNNSRISSTGTPTSALLSIGNLMSISVSGSYFTAPGNLFSSAPTGGSSTFLNSRLDCQSNGASTGLAATTTASGAQGLTSAGFIINVIDISNCNIGISSLTGVRNFTLLGAVSGSGNTTGMSFAKGAKAQVSATTTLTGGTNEVLIDGTNYTLAAMRAASPKSICDLSYLTCFYE